MNKLQPARGTRDILGDDARRHAYVVACFHEIAARYRFEPIEIPVFEFTPLFARGLGDASDIVAKEMYSFEDRGGESLTLRPEFTAGIARAYLSNGLQQRAPVKLHTHGPVFRYERPQKGRYRQFHQIDAEIIGTAEPQADIELIALARDLLRALGLMDKVTLHLNSLGDDDSRKAYRDALVKYFSGVKAQLSADSQMRLERNPLRILDSKDTGDHGLIAEAPLMSDYLTPEARAFFDNVTAGLEALSIDYIHDQRLVRGLDYYSHTAFEFITSALGAQGAVLAGGRYDGLIGMLGGPETPGVGWAAGIERLAMLIEKTPALPRPLVVIPMIEAAEAMALQLAQTLRDAGLVVELSARGKMKKRMKQASDIGASYALILGEDELKAATVAVKNLDTAEQQILPREQAIKRLVSGH